MMKLALTNTIATGLAKRLTRCSLLLLSLSCFLVPAHGNEKLTILTDSWPPYINTEGDTSGSAARLIEICMTLRALKQAGTTCHMNYLI